MLNQYGMATARQVYLAIGQAQYVWRDITTHFREHRAMKYITTFLILILSILRASGQEVDSTIHLLKPLDWEILNCVKSQIGQKEKATIQLINKSKKPIQAYFISHLNRLQKPKFALVEPNGLKKWYVSADEYWLVSDLNKNVLGFYKTLPGENKIIINDSNFLDTRKLPETIRDRKAPVTISGGVANAEQMAYDVTQYDIKMEIRPDEKYIKASNTISAIITNPIKQFVFDLDTMLKVNNVFLEKETIKVPLNVSFKNRKYWCKLPETYNKGEVLNVSVEYEGNPRSATHAPYQGGFSWNKTENCQHWIATSCQIDGADLWFPCKDYQWDEPDSVKLSFTVPDGLKAVSSGVLINTIKNKNQTTTFNWEVSNPINNYSISLNIAPYFELKEEYLSLYGDTINVFYWFLPEHEKNAKQLYPNIKNYLNFIETTIGPYPFRNEKLGIVEVPFPGMEHQTIIAFGPNFTEKYPGYNYVLFHELCHEWFGNMVTAYDWNDFWIQEALTGYTEALYEEYLQEEIGYKTKMELRRIGVKNKIPLATDTILNSREIFGDWSYAKSVYMIHSLRYLIGKENIIKVLRLVAYPDKELEHVTNGKQCRFVTTNDLFQTIEEVCGKNYDWFKDVYLYNAELPSLKVQQNEVGVKLSWVTKDNLPFNMPLELKTENGVQKIAFADNVANIDLIRDEILEFDPNNWILFNLEE
ncbi:MAG: M1 family peptidase [Calditrichaeota bacterium]|nr:MAG: M1 family peptidase [Calditrichota bacterium]